MFTKANSDHNTSGQPQTLISIKGPFLVHTHNGQEKDRLRLIQWEKRSVTDKTQIKPTWQKLNCCSPCDIMILYMPHVWKIHYNIRQQRTHCWIDLHTWWIHIFKKTEVKPEYVIAWIFHTAVSTSSICSRIDTQSAGTTVRSLLAQKHQCGWV